MNMEVKKPVVGNLVVLDWEELSMDERHSLDEKRLFAPGIIIKCTGIRCNVFWPDGKMTRPLRSVLKVLA
jgi:hypothetical protein